MNAGTISSPRRSAEDVVRLVTEGKLHSTRSWVPGRDSDVSAIECVRAEFDSSLIPPDLASIEVESHVAQVLNIQEGFRQVWFITKMADRRVFVDDESGQFGTAWGPVARTGRYVDLGFRTADPIDAFLA